MAAGDWGAAVAGSSVGLGVGVATVEELVDTSVVGVGAPEIVLGTCPAGGVVVVGWL